MRLIPLLLAFLVVGCASLKPKFQKGTPGYSVEGTVGEQGFLVKTDLGAKADDKFVATYGFRAVGEECLAHGFEYFDIAPVNVHEVEGYCFKTPDHPALAVEFTERGLEARPQHFVVHGLNGKTKTSLEKGDEILAVENAAPTSIATFKTAVYKAANAKKRTVKLKIKRDGKELEIQEPIALFKESALGSTQLDLVRSSVP